MALTHAFGCFWNMHFSCTATILSPSPDPCDGRGIQLAAMVAFDAGTLTVGCSLEVDFQQKK